MQDDNRRTAFWACLIVFAVIAAVVIGNGPGPIGSPHFVAWLVSVTVAAFAIRRYFFPPKR